MSVSMAEARETCTYLEWTGPWYDPQQKVKTRQCEYGCCGEDVDQTCCEQPKDDDYRRHWVIAASIAGGVVLLCVIVMVILCVMKAKNVRHARVYDGASSSRATRQTLMSPPRPYYPVNIFFVDIDSDRHHRVVLPQSGHSHGPQQGSEHAPPVFNGDQPSPPPYSFIDASPTREWKTWQS